MSPINVPIQIRFADVDMAGHVHNAVHLHWFETARMALQERFIPAEHDWREQGLILARNEVDYRMPPPPGPPIGNTVWPMYIN